MLDRDALKAGLLEAFKPKYAVGVPCAICLSRSEPMSLHLLEGVIPEGGPLPLSFVPMSSSRGMIRGCFPICKACAPICGKCGIAIQSKKVQEAFTALKTTAPQGVLVYEGNGYCRHLNLLKRFGQSGLDSNFKSPFERTDNAQKVTPTASEAQGIPAKAVQPARVMHQDPALPATRADVSQPAAFARYTVGSTIAGKYLVQKVIDGGLGRIFIVTFEDEVFVLKTVQPGKGDEDAFVTEARTWVSIGRHQNVVPARWVDRIAGMLCVAADYISPDDIGRTTVRDAIKLGKPTLRQTLSWAADFAYGMEHAQARGMIVHRDIKPENLLIGRNGILKITDFGIASSRQLEWPKSENMAVQEPHSISGTPSYMAPEQWRGQPQDFRTDVYAFGIVLYELAFGRLPWVTVSTAELRNCHFSIEPAIPEHPLSGVIAKAMSKLSTDRFETPGTLLEALTAVADRANYALPSRPPPSDDAMEELLAKASLSSTNNLDHSLAAASLLTERWPGFAAGWTQLGRLWLESNDLEKAQKALENSVYVDSTRSAPWHNLGVIASRKNNDERAVECFTIAIDCDNQNTGAMSSLAMALWFLGRKKQGIHWATKSVEIAPDKWNLWINLGSLHRSSGNEVEAQKCFKKGIALTPPSSRTDLKERLRQEKLKEATHTVIDVGQLLRERQFDVAIPLLVKASRDQPERPEIWHNLGSAYRELGKRDEAKIAFERLRQLKPHDTGVVLSLIELMRESCEWSAGLRLCDILAAIPGGQPDAIAKRAQILSDSGDPVEARKQLFVGMNQYPNHFGLRLTFGDVAMSAGAPLMAASKGYGPALRLVPKHKNKGLHDIVNARFQKALEAAREDGSI